LQAMISFLANSSRNVLFQNDMIDLLSTLVEAPHNASDQLVLLLFEPNIADSLYALVTQPDLDKTVQSKLLRLMRMLLKTKKVYEKSKTRLRLEDCGGFAG
jgi:hypothetical protein